MKFNHGAYICATLGLLIVTTGITRPVMGNDDAFVDDVQQTTKNAESRTVNELRVTWQMLRESVDAHPLTASGKQSVAASRASLDIAKEAPNPELEASIGYGRSRLASEERLEWGLSLSVPLDWAMKRGAKMNAAKTEVALAEAETEIVRQNLLFALRALFWGLVEGQENLAASVELYEQVEAIRATVERRVDAGEVRPIEAVRIGVETEKAAAELEVAKAVLAERRARLAQWIGGASGRVVVAVADLENLPTPMSKEAALQEADRMHPRMRAATARIQSLEDEIAVERRQRVPAMSARVFTDRELDRNAFGGGLTIALPLWNWNNASIRQASAMLEAEKKQAEAVLFELEGEIVEAQSACSAGVERATRYRNNILPNAASAANTIERTYDLGEVPLLDVMDARRTLAETRREYLEAMVKAQTDCSRLFVLVGRDVR